MESHLPPQRRHEVAWPAGGILSFLQQRERLCLRQLRQRAAILQSMGVLGAQQRGLS